MKKRHISAKKGLIIGILVGIILLASLLYLYHNQWKGVYVVDNVPTSLTGVGIIIGISAVICAIFVLGGFLLAVCFPDKSKSENKASTDA